MKTSRRNFSKWLVGINVALAWCAIFLAIIYMQASAVAVGAFGFIGLIAGTYMGIGHADYRAFLANVAASAVGGVFGPATQDGDIQGGGDFPLVDTSSQEKT
jgi:hypothetical protein